MAASHDQREAVLQDSAWLARTVELGPTYLTWWLSDWPTKRRMVLAQLDLLDPLRMLVCKGVVLRTDPGSEATTWVAEVGQ